MSERRTFGRAAFLVLAFECVWLPLEEFLLKWAPGGPAGYAALRIGFEGLLYLAVAALVAARLVRGLRLPATPIDVPLAAFLGLAACSLALSDGSLLQGLVNLRVLLRYVAVYYLAVYLELVPRERRLVLALVLGSAALQGVLGVVQHLQGGAGEFWLPRRDLAMVAGVGREFAALEGGLEQGAVIGTTDHSVGFALFLLVAGVLGVALLLGGAARGARRQAWLAAVVGLALAGILFSYARSCLFAFVLALALLVWLERRSGQLPRLASSAVLLAPFVLAAALLARGGERSGFVREKEQRIGPLASVEALFTREYLQSAQSSRLWVLGAVGEEIARSAGWLGFGPDEEHVKQRLLSSGGATLHRLIAYRAFEDVYWVALLAYFGFLGLGAFLLVLARLASAGRRAWKHAADPWSRAAAGTLLALLAVLVPLGFLAPTFDFRTFAFYFWLLAGLTAAELQPRSERRPVAVPRPALAARLA